MKPRSFSSRGLVLARINYGEADRIVFILSEDYGRLPFLAKGVRRLKSRKRGSLEPFTLVRFEAAKGKGLDILREVELLRSSSRLRRDLKKMSLAYYFAEVLGKILSEGEASKSVFNLALVYFEKLEKSSNLRGLRKDFVRDLLVALGFWPEDKKLTEVDLVLEQVLERKINSQRVGKRILV